MASTPYVPLPCSKKYACQSISFIFLELVTKAPSRYIDIIRCTHLHRDSGVVVGGNTCHLEQTSTHISNNLDECVVSGTKIVAHGILGGEAGGQRARGEEKLVLEDACQDNTRETTLPKLPCAKSD